MREKFLRDIDAKLTIIAVFLGTIIVLLSALVLANV